MIGSQVPPEQADPVNLVRVQRTSAYPVQVNEVAGRVLFLEEDGLDAGASLQRLF